MTILYGQRGEEIIFETKNPLSKITGDTIEGRLRFLLFVIGREAWSWKVCPCGREVLYHFIRQPSGFAAAPPALITCKFILEERGKK